MIIRDAYDLVSERDALCYALASAGIEVWNRGTEGMMYFNQNNTGNASETILNIIENYIKTLTPVERALFGL